MHGPLVNCYTCALVHNVSGIVQNLGKMIDLPVTFAMKVILNRVLQ
jgi:hypothetical protein